ncbi:hypothetical protein EYF80_020951 [Liparis tanakae]|uniref:Uncharacterized protein n=1 Tax=Liparis tanakae TaxID=230148 RepID=A0A4Z2HUX4_9TELE|nr:hypothetical protein EYF80_020951 [Liparis tanakae]
MTVLYTVRACARRWNVREIPFPKLVGEKHKYPTKQNPGRFWNPCRTHFLGLKKRTCPGKRGRLVALCTPPPRLSLHHAYSPSHLHYYSILHVLISVSDIKIRHLV